MISLGNFTEFIKYNNKTKKKMYEPNLVMPTIVLYEKTLHEKM